VTETFEFISSASLADAYLLRLEDEIRSLGAGGCDELHFGIMDGVFAPRISFGTGVLIAANEVAAMPCSVHLMVVHPERHIERYRAAGADIITVNVEACRHPHRVLSQIRETGASPGIAINPGTPLTKLDYLLDLVDRVTVMCVDPGFGQQTVPPIAFERVRILSENLKHRKLPARVCVDGNVTVQNAAHLSRMGATVFVLGAASIFNGGDPGDNLVQFTESVATQRHLV